MNLKGESAGFSGDKTITFSNHMQGENYICAGNTLKGPKVLSSMANTFSKSTGSLAEKLLKALKAGHKAGGDKRKKTYGSGSLKISKDKHDIFGLGDDYINLRIDYSKTPIKDLTKLLNQRKKSEVIYSSQYKY